MRGLLIHQGLKEVFGEAISSKKTKKVSDENILDVFKRAHSAIILSLSDGVLREVDRESRWVIKKFRRYQH